MIIMSIQYLTRRSLVPDSRIQYRLAQEKSAIGKMSEPEAEVAFKSDVKASDYVASRDNQRHGGSRDQRPEFLLRPVGLDILESKHMVASTLSQSMGRYSQERLGSSSATQNLL